MTHRRSEVKLAPLVLSRSLRRLCAPARFPVWTMFRGLRRMLQGTPLIRKVTFVLVEMIQWTLFRLRSLRKWWRLLGVLLETTMIETPLVCVTDPTTGNSPL